MSIAAAIGSTQAIPTATASARKPSMPTVSKRASTFWPEQSRDSESRRNRAALRREAASHRACRSGLADRRRALNAVDCRLLRRPRFVTSRYFEGGMVMTFAICRNGKNIFLWLLFLTALMVGVGRANAEESLARVVKYGKEDIV